MKNLFVMIKIIKWLIQYNELQLNLFVAMILVVIFNSCSDTLSVNSIGNVKNHLNRDRKNVQKSQLDPLQNQQINGYVYFEDGTKLESWNPVYYARAFYATDTINAILGSEDEIDPIGGHYGISGINNDYPTGLYLIKTDFVS